MQEKKPRLPCESFSTQFLYNVTLAIKNFNSILSNKERDCWKVRYIFHENFLTKHDTSRVWFFCCVVLFYVVVIVWTKLKNMFNLHTRQHVTSIIWYSRFYTLKVMLYESGLLKRISFPSIRRNWTFCLHQFYFNS